jgi:hypothetical protein
MSEQQVFSTIKTHTDNDGDIVPEFGSGTDTIAFTIPSGKQFKRYSIQKLPGTSLFAGYEVTDSPGAKAKGAQKIKVKWNYEMFGKIRYSLRVFADSPGVAAEDLQIDITDTDVVEQALQAIQQDLDFRIIVSGKSAGEMWNAIKRQIPHATASTAQPVQPNTAPVISLAQPVQPGPAFLTGIEEVALGIGIIAGIVAVAGLATIVSIALVAISNGYNVVARHRARGPSPFDNELEIIVTKT